MSDMFALFSDTVSSPARRLRAVVPNDSADLPEGIAKSLYVGQPGVIWIIAADDTEAVEWVAGQGLLPVRAKRVMATSTSASKIVALY